MECIKLGLMVQVSRKPAVPASKPLAVLILTHGAGREDRRATSSQNNRIKMYWHRHYIFLLKPLLARAATILLSFSHYSASQ